MTAAEQEPGPRVTIWRRRLAAEIVDGDRRELEACSTDYEPEPGESPADFATGVISVEGCDTEPSSYPDWGGLSTWYLGEPYEHPHTGEVHETSAHLHGFSEADSREVYGRLFPQRQADHEAGQ